MKGKIVLCSNNEGKIKEYQEILSSLNIEVISLKQAGIVSNPKEEGNTYRANAYIKASSVKKLTPYPVIGDDSGLEIEALNGFPGLLSSRYASSFSAYQEAWNDLNRKIGDNPNRKAHFHCCICLLEESDSPKYFEGDCYGEILRGALGNNGFGYDPIFLSYELGKGLGLASEQEKNKISHRGKAIEKLYEYLEKGEKHG